MCTRRAPARAMGGISMIELIVFIVIITVNVAGILAVLNFTTARSADPLQRKQAILIAEGLLEEVSLARMTFCPPDDPKAETAEKALDCTTQETVGPASGATRPYPSINDYVGSFGVRTSFIPPPATGGARDTTGVIQDALGNVLFGGQYRAFVTINANATLGPAAGLLTGSGNADTNLLHISVAVSYGNGEEIVLDRFRTRYAPNSTP